MLRRTVVVDSKQYQFAADDEPPRSQRWWGLVHAQVVDEITGRAPASTISVTPPSSVVTAKVADNGAVGLVGVPRHVYSATAPSFRMDTIVEVPGFVSRNLSPALPTQTRVLAAPINPNDTVLQLNSVANLSKGVTLLIDVGSVQFEEADISALGPGVNEVTVNLELKQPHAIGRLVVPVVPDDFAPVDVGSWELHREPVVIRGRVMEAAGAGVVPAGNATVKVVDVWRRVPSIGVVVPPETSLVVSLRPPLYRDRGVPGTTIRRRLLPLLAASSKQLLKATPIGKLSIRISDSVGLAFGDVVAVGFDDQSITEYAEIQAINSSPTPNQPATIILTLPLQYQHRQGAKVQKTNPQPLGSVNQFDQAGLHGDTCIFVDGLNGIANGDQVEINDGSIVERHVVNVFQVKSDPDGFYSFPPIHRVGQLKVRAEFGGKSQEFLFQPDYAVRENRVDFVVK